MRPPAAGTPPDVLDPPWGSLPIRSISILIRDARKKPAN